MNTFDEVVKRYNSIRPVASKDNAAEEDIRPISARSRKWERIKKIDEHTYAILDGVYGHTMTGHWKRHAGMHEWENTMAPMVWIRKPDGDYLRLRNHYKSSSSVVRYNMWRRWLPAGIGLMDHGGRGATFVVVTPTGPTRFLLPKTSCHWDANKNRMTEDDGRVLLFKVHGDGTYTRAGEPMNVVTTRVDRELKKQYAPAIEGYYLFCASIAPMLDLSWKSRMDYRTMLHEGRTQRQCSDAQLRREIVTTEDHPLRVAYAAETVSQIGGHRPVNTPEDLRRMKARFNRAMNNDLNLFAHGSEEV